MSTLAEAAAFLETELAGGPVPASVLLDRAQGAGISRRTLFRAKGARGIASRRLGFEPSSGWVWGAGTLGEKPHENGAHAGARCNGSTRRGSNGPVLDPPRRRLRDLAEADGRPYTDYRADLVAEIRRREAEKQAREAAEQRVRDEAAFREDPGFIGRGPRSLAARRTRA